MIEPKIQENPPRPGLDEAADDPTPDTPPEAREEPNPPNPALASAGEAAERQPAVAAELKGEDATSFTRSILARAITLPRNTTNSAA